jgi:hypothetical protein
MFRLLFKLEIIAKRANNASASALYKCKLIVTNKLNLN